VSKALRADVLDEMRGHLEGWMIETEDPLLEGPITAPEGAALNGRDQLSPDDRRVSRDRRGM